MKDADVHLLRQDGWSLEVLNTLCSLGYELASYDAAACEGHFNTPQTGDLPRVRCLCPHGFTLHRQDTPAVVRQAIFEAGIRRQEQLVQEKARHFIRALGLKLG